MNAECRVQSAEWGKNAIRRARGVLISFCILHSAFCTSASAAPSQQDVFKSIESNVGETGDPRRIIAVICGVIAVIVVLVLLNRRQRERAAPKALNHQGKLIKEVLKQVRVKPAEMRRLKTLAQEQSCSPLTLLLCPSVLARAMKERKQG